VKQYEIAVDPERLGAMGITIADVFTAVARNNANTGGAYIESRPNHALHPHRGPHRRHGGHPHHPGEGAAGPYAGAAA
jgi:hypothetical protein